MCVKIIQGERLLEPGDQDVVERRHEPHLKNSTVMIANGPRQVWVLPEKIAAVGLEAGMVALMIYDFNAPNLFGGNLWLAWGDYFEVSVQFNTCPFLDFKFNGFSLISHITGFADIRLDGGRS